MSSLVFVVTALEAIANSKEAQKSAPLIAAVQQALKEIKENEPQLPDPDIIFAPLQLATKVGSISLCTTALDCIGKLISYSYFSVSSHQSSDKETLQNPLIERAIDNICDCFQGETTAVEIQLQIVKSLLAAVLNDKIVVHGAGLLKAVRQVYNVFLLSKSSANQQVAQGTLTQMVGTVFERVKTRLDMKATRLNLLRLKNKTNNSSELTANSTDLNDASTAGDVEDSIDENVAYETRSIEEGPKLTLKDLENCKSFDDSLMGEGPTMVTQVKSRNSHQTLAEHVTPEEDIKDSIDSDEDEDEVYIRDAYLVFRSFCNLSTKVLPADQLYDLKGQAMRSKLISLHLIQTLLSNNILVFTSPLCTIKNSRSNEPTGFLQAIKFYLCLSITRNGASSVDKIFEICCEILWLMMKYMRASFKREIEVFLHEIYLALLERRNAPIAQKLYFMGILQRLCGDPRALVETYLNYDCDRNVDNMFQTLIEDLSKAASVTVIVSPQLQQQHEEKVAKSGMYWLEWQSRGALPPSLSTSHITDRHATSEDEVPKEYIMKRQALYCLVEALRSLVNWSQQGIADMAVGLETEGRNSEDLRNSLDQTINDSSLRTGTAENNVPSTPVVDDDPEQLGKEKQRKTALSNAIQQFNFKPKRGIKLLISEKFIQNDSPEKIAQFLLSEERLDKAQIGEYLGEGEDLNIAIMHAFVDCMDFTKRRFVDALRQFLQSFRLPGEAQKIDRFMLKFANRYVTGNPNAFANADTAYVLAYSVILLNTDLHSSKVAKRMTKLDFIKNNRGINDNANLPDEYLNGIYDEIANEEIVLRSEREAAAAMGVTPIQPIGIAAGFGQALATVGRDLQREAYLQQSEEISQRSELLFKDLFRNQRKNAAKNEANKFIPATSFKHVGPMFGVTWMSFFSGLSGQMQNSHNIETIRLCMEGMKLAVRVACVFDLETPREAFVSVLKNCTNLNNPTEIMAKNIEALKVLLEIGQTEGDLLKSSWRDVLMCVSQLDRLQLISDGVDEGSIPDVSKSRIVAPSDSLSESRKSTQSLRPQRTRIRSTAASSSILMKIALEGRSDEFIKGVDRIFTSTAKLSGDAIVHFVKALTEISWEEIKISGQNESPRTYSLQKLVEISYYNMTRVRFEWTNIWGVLGEHFNRVGCYNNTAVVFFALDSLRQLSMRFMEIEELPGFQFQKDFLKPFEHVMSNSTVIAVKDMALRCLIQMIQARGENIRSGWRTMFGVFTVAAKEPYEGIVNLAFDNVNQIYKTRFGVVISQGAFADLIVCLTEFSKNMKFQKKGLQALETLKSIIPTMLKTSECPISRQAKLNPVTSLKLDEAPSAESRTSREEAFWFPVLFAFHDVLMTGEDLEVRSNALNYLFDALIRYGGDFPPNFWDTLWRHLLYPIFMVLKSSAELSDIASQEELSVWLSTTMIQALRNVIILFTHYFTALEYMLDRFLDLLALCITQENDTIARIGSNCLQQLILQNVTKFKPENWSQIVGVFVELFERTTAYQLFTATTTSGASTGRESISLAEDFTDIKSLRINGTGSSTLDVEGLTDQESKSQSRSSNDLEDYKPQSELQQRPVVVTAARRKFFNQIITKCVLQLLIIETVNELFSNETVYAQIPSPELLRLMSLLKKSFLFARKFNENKELRMRLWREGFMKQPPNLLKQESGSAATYVSILLRMYHDEGEERKRNRDDTENALVPLCADIIRGFTLLEEDSQQRNIFAWRPVVVEVLEGYTNFPAQGFEKHINTFYPLGVDLLSREQGVEVRIALQAMLRRVGEVQLGIPELRRPSTTMSPEITSRRSSRRD
ncbi:BgTH12-00162 [Blumeria graminis f. sp. triticale]|uniref:Bgt-4074 n=3 Tax=Blumeria graminis TaxID=34373 RepID=A0A381L475_BLUGR|nr:Guanine nucleotide exchange factor (GEF) [Blumeria graminis f. sp. tritici 96224]CAD6504656.1 BgTH12-00162 [Blumeria graminis f. sp. triticale]VDB92688.1 Bgt-4074 [Blumeria graminis f. sp. tritici]